MRFWARKASIKARKSRSVEQRLDDIELLLSKMSARLNGPRRERHLSARIVRLQKVVSTAKTIVPPFARQKLEAAVRRGLRVSTSAEGKVPHTSFIIGANVLSTGKQMLKKIMMLWMDRRSLAKGTRATMWGDIMGSKNSMSSSDSV